MSPWNVTKNMAWPPSLKCWGSLSGCWLGSRAHEKVLGRGRGLDPRLRTGRSRTEGAVSGALLDEVGDDRTMGGAHIRIRHPAPDGTPSRPAEDVVDPQADAPGEHRVAEPPARPGERIGVARPVAPEQRVLRRQVEVSRQQDRSGAPRDPAPDQVRLESQFRGFVPECADA